MLVFLLILGNFCWSKLVTARGFRGGFEPVGEAAKIHDSLTDRLSSYSRRPSGILVTAKGPVVDANLLFCFYSYTWESIIKHDVQLFYPDVQMISVLSNVGLTGHNVRKHLKRLPAVLWLSFTGMNTRWYSLIQLKGECSFFCVWRTSVVPAGHMRRLTPSGG